MAEFTVTSTSSQTADVDHPLITSLRDNPDGSRVRRVVTATCVENRKNPIASLQISVRHQKRASLSSTWAPVDGFGPVNLQPGQEIRLDFDSAETRGLYERLAEWYAVCGRGVSYGEKRLRVVDENETIVLEKSQRELLAAIMESESGFWELVEEVQPDFIAAATAARLQRTRLAAVQEFARHLREEDWDEPAWQEFFETNVWIFGHSLAYQFLRPVQTQPHFGGGGVDRVGAKIGDFLLATEARARFTVLVEIKKPNTDLLGPEYRGGIFAPSRELAGGVIQTQTASRTWVTEGERAEANRERLATERTETYEPKSILVVGSTSRLTTVAQRRSFELFRRNLHNPEIVTFDELFERSRFLVEGDREEPNPLRRRRGVVDQGVIDDA